MSEMAEALLYSWSSGLECHGFRAQMHVTKRSRKISAPSELEHAHYVHMFTADDGSCGFQKHSHPLGRSLSESAIAEHVLSRVRSRGLDRSREAGEGCNHQGPHQAVLQRHNM